jgi:hypothetical protein
MYLRQIKAMRDTVKNKGIFLIAFIDPHRSTIVAFWFVDFKSSQCGVWHLKGFSRPVGTGIFFDCSRR